MERQLAALESESPQEASVEDLVHRLNQLHGETAKLQEDLKRAEEEAAGKQVSYAIVPYEGNHQTLRRPIYIECRSDAVILQPEGIRLTVSDFYGPLDPANPLASALRSANEFFAENALAGQGPVGEPYPFFLVRPDGVITYAVARTALRSWGSEFGYELVEQDWNLKYPPKDPGLAKAERVAVERARQRRLQLARMAPSYYGDRRPMSFDRMDGVPRGDTDEVGGGGRGHGGGRGDLVGSGSGAVDGETEFSGGNSFSSEHELQQGLPSGTDGSEVTDNGQPLAGGLPEGADGPSGVGGSAGSATSLGNPQGSRGTSSTAASSEASNTTPGSNPNVGPAAFALPDNSSASLTMQKLAERRGRDWALPESTRDSIGIRRPIHVYCRDDHLGGDAGRSGSTPGKDHPLGESNGRLGRRPGLGRLEAHGCLGHRR